MRPALVLGTGHLNDEELLRQFDACVIPAHGFHHEDHIRLAWLQVRRMGNARAEEHVVEAIRRFASSLGHPEKFHETQTRAWVRLVSLAVRLSPCVEDFAAFADQHPWLFNRKALDAFYSIGRLADARHQWIEPDLQGLP